METRLEKDLLGEKSVPARAYWGIHTQRALENFPASRRPVNARLIRALAQVKQAACAVNEELGYLPHEKAQAIALACDEVASGEWAEQFPLDALQGGAGTSTNMNVNEVLANRALEILGRPRGDYACVHPIEDVNRHQSTNDVYPTALRVAAIGLLRELSGEIAALQGAFQRKEKEFAAILKIGRTECQEAVPMTLGAEFGAFAEAIARDRWRVFKCEERLRVTNLGGTAVGTGLGAPRDYIFRVIEKLRQITGLGLSRSENVPGDTAFADAFVEVSGILKAHAANLSKCANDLRWMNLLGEVRLPKTQAGSSIMAGKVNPVIAEWVIQCSLQVQANDLLVHQSAAWGSFQICEFMPLVAASLLDSLELLRGVNRRFAEHVAGIEADAACCAQEVDHSRTVVTAFLPSIGYDQTGQLARELEGAEQPANVRGFLEKRFGREAVERILSSEYLTQLGHRHGPHA